MKDNYYLFDYTGHFESDPEFIQHRYVCAPNEAEAEKLIEKYSKDLVRRGFDRFIHHGNPIVDTQSVIVA